MSARLFLGLRKEQCGVLIMDDDYVYIQVKLYLKPGQTPESIQEIVSECDYNFSHKEIIETEIRDIIDLQTSRAPEGN